jgi:hypothetical protein
MTTPTDSDLPQFGRQFFGAAEAFTRIGSGELGGKAAGLELIREQILSALDPAAFPDIAVGVPTLTVLTTELFDLFMTRNDLYPIALAEEPDERIAAAFQDADLPAEFVGDLRALITKVHTPLAVRSSSLLEDALDHPFAGVYETKMIPNNQPDTDTRFRRLVEAIKFVYASVFFRQAKSYIRSIGQDPRAEKMAVVIQEVLGSRYGDRFYPFLSGVGRSYNYYPSGHGTPADGVINLALGLGKQIVDGGLSWTYCPVYPQAPAPFKGIGDLLKNTQTEFWAVNMGKPPRHDPIHETEYLVRAALADAELDGTLEHLVSVYDPRSDRFYPGLRPNGPRLLDFAPILTAGALPLNDLVRLLLERSAQALGADVEIEFAVDYERRRTPPARFGFLQVRPMKVSDQEIRIVPEAMEGAAVVLASDQVLGNGQRDDIRDVVFVKPAAFDPKFTPRIAQELDQINRSFLDEERPYLLIGFGRWGSSDPWLGIPVDWGQISAARVIVEATLPDMNPDLSQGSHFFHNLIGFQVLYLSVRHSGRYRIDHEWLDRQETIAETEHVKHVRVAAPLQILVDGRHGIGVIRHG